MATLNKNKLIQGVVELLPNIKDKIKETINEFNNYLEVLKDEKFEENEGDDDAIKRAEGIYDRLDEMKKRNQLVLKSGNETIDLICNLKSKMESVAEVCENDEIQLAKTNNELIDKIVELEERKRKREIMALQNRIDEINQILNNKRNEWNCHKTNIKDILHKQKEEKRIRKTNEIITVNEIQQIEEWTRRKVGNIIFDSNVDNWKEGTSVFDQKIINKSNLIFLIEDDDDNKFGGYADVEIYKSGRWIGDSKSFVFSLKSNGRLNGMSKFDNKEAKSLFGVYPKNNEELFAFGKGNDIQIYKETDKNKSYCKQSAFNYDVIENALCGKETFTPVRITVIQMELDLPLPVV